MKKYIIRECYYDGNTKETYTEDLATFNRKTDAVKNYNKILDNAKNDENSVIKNLLEVSDCQITDADEWYLVVSKTENKKAMIEIKEVWKEKFEKIGDNENENNRN